MSDMEILLLVPKGYTRWCGNSKGLSDERGYVKSAENLDVSPFKRDSLIDTTISLVRAGQSL
jgi:hypothetical protein